MGSCSVNGDIGSCSDGVSIDQAACETEVCSDGVSTDQATCEAEVCWMAYPLIKQPVKTQVEFGLAVSGVQVLGRLQSVLLLQIVKGCQQMPVMWLTVRAMWQIFLLKPWSVTVSTHLERP